MDCLERIAHAKAAGAYQLTVPNCKDPVFRVWCNACGLIAGRSYSWDDARVRQLEQLMAEDYDPLSDYLDDPFQSELS